VVPVGLADVVGDVVNVVAVAVVLVAIADVAPGGVPNVVPNVVSRWPSALGGLLGMTKFRTPPFFGVCAAAGPTAAMARPRPATSAMAVFGTTCLISFFPP